MNVKFTTKKIFMLFSLKVLTNSDFEFYIDAKVERSRISTRDYDKNKFFSNLVLLNGILKTNIAETDPNYSLELLRTATKGHEELLRQREVVFNCMKYEDKVLIVERFEKLLLAAREVQYGLFLQTDQVTTSIAHQNFNINPAGLPQALQKSM